MSADEKERFILSVLATLRVELTQLRTFFGAAMEHEKQKTRARFSLLTSRVDKLHRHVCTLETILEEPVETDTEY